MHTDYAQWRERETSKKQETSKFFFSRRFFLSSISSHTSFHTPAHHCSPTHGMSNQESGPSRYRQSDAQTYQNPIRIKVQPSRADRQSASNNDALFLMDDTIRREQLHRRAEKWVDRLCEGTVSYGLFRRAVSWWFSSQRSSEVSRTFSLCVSLEK
jgi:hypothetical protein